MYPCFQHETPFARKSIHNFETYVFGRQIYDIDEDIGLASVLLQVDKNEDYFL
jgi:hypothetical protein